MATLIGLIHGETPSYGISFPDLPGCVGGGATIDACMESGRKSAELYLEGMARDSETLPEFRSLDALRTDAVFVEDLGDAALVVALDVVVPGKSVRLNISLDDSLVQRIDRAAERAGQSRSAFLAAAARDRLHAEA